MIYYVMTRAVSRGRISYWGGHKRKRSEKRIASLLVCTIWDSNLNVLKNIRRHQVKLKYLGSVAVVEVSEPLNVIEKQPSEGYESENYE